jgi:hypothetical protein
MSGDHNMYGDGTVYRGERSADSGAAIQRYKIGYHADEWGQRSSTPGGIPDASGSWVRYADHVTALAAGQATAAQADTQPAPALWVSPEQFANLTNTQAPFGTYLPARKTSAGKFTMPLFAARAPASAQPVAEPADTVVLNAAMRAIQQAIELIGDPTDERMRAVRRVLRGAVIVAEDAGEVAPRKARELERVLVDQLRAFADATYALRASHGQAPADAAPSAGAVAGPDDIDAIALTRYKVVHSHDSMFHRFAVVAGDGKQQLYLGREAECENMARKLAGAFLDGAFYQSNIAPTPAAQAADSVQEDAARLDFLIDQRAYVVSDPDACPGHWLHWARPDGSTWVQCDEHPTPRAAIDAARKQGASHDNS